MYKQPWSHGPGLTISPPKAVAWVGWVQQPWGQEATLLPAEISLKKWLKIKNIFSF